MKATLLCAFLVVFQAALYVLGVPDFYGGIGGIGGGGYMHEYDGETIGGGGMMDEYDGETIGGGGMMDEYDGEMGVNVVNGPGGGTMGIRDGFKISCVCHNFYKSCPGRSIHRGTGLCPCGWWKCRKQCCNL